MKTRFKLSPWEIEAIRLHGATQLRRIVDPNPAPKYTVVYPETLVPGIPEWLWSKSTSGQGAEQQDLFWLKNKPVQRIGDKICHVCKDGSRIEFLVRKVEIVPAYRFAENEQVQCGVPVRRKDWKYSQPMPDSISESYRDDVPLDVFRCHMFWVEIAGNSHDDWFDRLVWKIDIEILQM